MPQLTPIADRVAATGSTMAGAAPTKG